MDITFYDPLVFLGIVFLFAGGILVLVGLDVIKITYYIDVKPGKKTLLTGIVIVLLGGGTLWKELSPPVSENNQGVIENQYQAELISQVTPTPTKDATDFFDDFEAGPKPEWQPLSGDWTVIDRKYTVGNVKAKGVYITSLQNKQWTDVSISVDVTLGKIYSKPPLSHKGWAWVGVKICPRMIDKNNGVCFWVGGENGVVRSGGFHIQKEGNWGQSRGDNNTDISEAKTVQVKVEVKNSLFTGYVDEKEVAQIHEPIFSSGFVGIILYYSTTDFPTSISRTYFDNVKVTSLK